MNKVNILWTGGLDSTYRVLELSMSEVTIQPYYLANVNPSTQYEINAILRNTEAILSRPGTKCTLLPLIVVHSSQIKPSAEITAAWERLHALSRLGSQYDWIARFADQYNLTLELGIEKDDKESTIVRCLSQSGGYSILNNEEVVVSEEGTADAKLVFKNMRFPLPLFNMTKQDEIEQFKRWGATKVLNRTWFCYRPVNGKPCGLCDPCQTYIEVGLGNRIPKNRLRLYYFRKNHEKLFTGIRNLKRRVRSLFR